MALYIVFGIFTYLVIGIVMTGILFGVWDNAPSGDTSACISFPLFWPFVALGIICCFGVKAVMRGVRTIRRLA